MPPEAKMVFKGKIFEVWQWQQQVFDGTVRTFERLKRPDTVEIFAIVGDKICVHDEQQPDSGEFVTMPAGRVEPGEEPLPAAKRELLEETGYTSDDWQLAGEEMPSGKIEWTIHIFVARNCRKKQEPNPEPGEKILSRLVSFDELLSLCDDPKFRSTATRFLLWRARLDEKRKEELRALLFKE
ncbi:MAG: NUDIX hydrolase [Parcubacteria group bacterium Gr01-1014_8]|nr:MAG: NUDIX hydrolase [Parcubacteria group bacterium Gr01-1014_8]